MKCFLLSTITFLAITITCKAQWTTGTNINNTNTGNVGIGTTNAPSLLTVGAGNSSTNSKVAINTANANVNALLLSNWIGSATAYGPKLAFDNSTFGAWSMGASDGANNFDIARTWVTPDFRISSAGNVGIGTTNPSAALQIGNFSGGGTNQLLIPGTYNFEQVRLGQIGNGNSALEFVNHNGVPSSYGIKFLVDVDHGTSGLQIQYAPATTSYASLSYTTGLYLNLLGNVGIGTTTPDQKLSVNGTIHSKSVLVDLTGWPDYVFKPTYKLPTLTEVKTYIAQNHHLPDVPSAAEVEKNGLNLGEMNKVLVQKVEELTLYLMEQHKQLADQQKTNQSQQKQIDELKKSLDSINHKKSK
jgi:hypothetical protein